MILFESCKKQSLTTYILQNKKLNLLTQKPAAYSAGLFEKLKRKLPIKALSKLSKQNNGNVDQLFHELHEEVFNEIDCLACANCCKTTGPLWTNKDIERVAKHLRLKPSSFIDQYLRIDEEDDYVLQQVPCPFLGTDDYCSIYDVRPKACREYPHTDRTKQSQLFKLHLKNTEICPAVFEIFERIKEKQ